MNEDSNIKTIAIYCGAWNTGGIESFLSNVLTNMDISGFEISIIADSIQTGAFFNRLKEKNIQFIQLSGNTKAYLQNLYLFVRQLSKKKYDVVYLNAFQAVQLTFLAAARLNGVSQRIAHSHNCMLRNSKSYYIKKVIHQLCKLMFGSYATKMWACSDCAAQFLFTKKLLQNRGVTIIPDGIETERFRFDRDIRNKIREEYGISGRYVIGNVGRLCVQKNQTYLIDVFVKIKAVQPESVLLLIGDGPDLNYIKDYSRRAGVSSSVLFVGFVDNVNDFYCAMDVFAFPSLFEGLGIAVLEAQACGLPVICSENIPEEAIVTELVKQIPLDSGIIAWRNAIIEAAQNVTMRKSYTEALCNAGYDVCQVAEMVRREFLSL